MSQLQAGRRHTQLQKKCLERERTLEDMAREDGSTEAILSVIHDWHSQMDKGADVQAIFFDLQKA